MFKAFVCFGLITTVSALRNMRPRDQEGTSFLDMFDTAVEEREALSQAPEALVEQPSSKQSPDYYGYDYYFPGGYYFPGDGYYGNQTGGNYGYYGYYDPYYYYFGGGGMSGNNYPGITDPDWQRPWNIVNGACSTENNGKKHVMEITSVAGGAYYLGVIDIGTPRQPLNMILDTGSDEIVIKSSDCNGCYGYGYDMKKSSTSTIDDYGPNAGLTSFAYGSGPVVCQRINDTVHLGDFQGDGMGIQMIVDTSISFFQEDDKFALHAVVGMAPGMPEYVGNTLASNMEVRTFSECLPKNTEENGFFVVNDDSADLKANQGFSGPFRSLGEYYWAAGITGLRLDWDGSPREKYGNKESIQLYSPETTIVGIVDTGTSLLSMPQAVMDELNRALWDLNFDCGKMRELPKMMFEIDGVTHHLLPEDYVAISDGSMWWLKKGKNQSKTVNNIKDTIAARKLFFHKPGKPQFIDKQTGHECMLLFTDPLYQVSDEGEMAILGMPFFREYEITFDFCTKEMFTKQSEGDCSKKVGQHPSNVQWCNDKNWLGCWAEGFTNFFKGVWEGIVKVFAPQRGEGVDPNDRVAQKKAHRTNQHKLASIKPEALRLSSAASWLLRQKKSNGIVSL